MGIEIVNHPADTPATTAPAAAAPADNYGLKAVGPANATPLPPVEKPAEAPDAVNDIKPGEAPPAQQPSANGKKNAKPAWIRRTSPAAQKKKKKGLGKLNPF